jgi:MFS family permease
MTGINAILYFTPQLFASLGGGPNMNLISAIIVNSMMVLAGFTSILLVDKLGRKPLLIGGGTLMFLTQISVAIVLATNFDPSGTVPFDTSLIYIVLVLICAFTFAFGKYEHVGCHFTLVCIHHSLT